MSTCHTATVFEQGRLQHATRKRVLLCSPWRPTSDESPAHTTSMHRHAGYARLIMKDSLQRQEAPLVLHLHYPMVLPAQGASRGIGQKSICAWMCASELVVFYTDLGMTAGMSAQLELANALHVPVAYRSLRELDDDWEAELSEEIGAVQSDEVFRWMTTDVVQDIEDEENQRTQMKHSMRNLVQSTWSSDIIPMIVGHAWYCAMDSLYNNHVPVFAKTFQHIMQLRSSL